MKLEEGKTNIYISGELFNECKYLMLNIPIADTGKLDEIKCIDEAAEILGWTYDGQEGVVYQIDPEIEFWGHCSNLQAWYEHGYDTRLLHSNLAFPLLKKLTESGDPKAKKVFKEEIAKRINSGYFPVFLFLIQENFLTYFNEEELNLIEADLKDIDFTEKIISIDNIKTFLRRNQEVLVNTLDYIEDYYDWFEYEELLDKIQSIYLNMVLKIIFKFLDDSEILNFLLKIAKTRVFGQYYPPSWATSQWGRINPDEIDSDRDILYEDKVFPYILNDITQIKDLLLRNSKSKNKKVLNLSRKVLDEYIDIFYDNIKFKMGSEEWTEEIFSAFLESIDKLSIERDYDAFNSLLWIAKQNEWIIKQLPALLNAIVNISYHQFNAFSNLLKIINEKGLIKEYLIDILGIINQLRGLDKDKALYALIKLLKDTGLLKEQFLNVINQIHDGEKINAYTSLLNLFKETGLIREHFRVLLEIIDQLPEMKKYYAFSDLIKTIQDTDLIMKYSSQIETQFLVFIENMKNEPVKYVKHYKKYSDHNKYMVFTKLLEIARIIGLKKDLFHIFYETMRKSLDSKSQMFSSLLVVVEENNWIEDFFSDFIDAIDEIDDKDKYYKYSHLLKIAEEKELIEEYFDFFLTTIDKLVHGDKYLAFAKLIHSINNTKLSRAFYSQVEPLFLSLIEDIDKVKKTRLQNKYKAFSTIIDAVKSTELWSKNYTQIESKLITLLEPFKNLSGNEQYPYFSSLLQIVKGTELMKKYYDTFLEIFPILKDIENIYDKWKKYTDFIKAVEGSGLENEVVFKNWMNKNKRFL
ncbi:MAG: hypothetical protein ACFE8L_10180 [Candidatus Hodarchaeota archaeon]